MKRSWLPIIVSFAVGILAATGIFWWQHHRGAAFGHPSSHDRMEETRAAGKSAAALYHCPMHPTYVSERPGDCPICGMRLVPIEEPKPAEPVDEHEGHEGPMVAGYATVNIPSHKQQYIGVRTDRVQRKRLESSVKSVGRVDYDETGLAWVNTKVGGWIEVLHVDQTGQLVRRGQPLLELYSPELVATQEEFLIALENLRRLESGNARPEALRQARDLIEDGRRRLELWDIPPSQILALEERGQIVRRLPLEAPSSGFVVDKSALQGQYVNPGENLYRIADLSRVWIQAEVFEQEASLIRPGQEAEIRLPYAPGRTYRGRVDYIYPYLDPATRTIRVRLVVPNPELTLRPEMYADVRFTIPQDGDLLVVPNEAILDTGERQIAFVNLGDGVFEPRELKVGLRTREYTVVLEGLEEGEPVVVSGNFLIDSESRLKAALSGMGAGGVHQH
jgi:membrane fusion protein, copper/silver efflux system